MESGLIHYRKSGSKVIPGILCGLLVLLPAGPGQASPRTRLVDDFSSSSSKEVLPHGWDLKENKGKAWVRVESENGNKVLHLIARKSSFRLNKRLAIDIKKYPILTWRWKVMTLPAGGDVRNKSKDDQAAQIYLHFARFPKMINFWDIGYIWDSVTPKGSILPSRQPIGSRVQYIVLQSGSRKLGQWVSERRNVYKDHKRLFGKNPPELMGIALMIDSDNTNSSAECYFDDLAFHQY